VNLKAKVSRPQGGQAMDDLRHLIDCENNFPSRFAAVRERPYGKLFYNTANPASHDSNHAMILDPACDPGRALADIVSFYESIEIAPRVYSSYRDGELDWLRPYLAEHGFQIKQFDDHLFTLTGPSRIVPNPALAVQRVRALEPAAAEILRHEDGGDWSVNVIRQVISRSDYHLLVGCAGGAPVCTASLSLLDGLSRLDDVVTHHSHRGSGYGRTLIDYAVRYHRSLTANGLYLWSINPVAIRIYEAAGFTEYPARPVYWTAWKE
jgi:GNAT superfamily N-acetyltransferase